MSILSNNFNYENLNNSKYDEIKTHFENVFLSYDLGGIFSGANININVSYLEVKSVVNPDGKYRQDLIELSSNLQTTSNENFYNQSNAYEILNELGKGSNNRSFQHLMNRIRKLNKYLRKVVADNKGSYRFSVVKYAEIL